MLQDIPLHFEMPNSLKGSIFMKDRWIRLPLSTASVGHVGSLMSSDAVCVILLSVSIETASVRKGQGEAPQPRAWIEWLSRYKGNAESAFIRTILN